MNINSCVPLPLTFRDDFNRVVRVPLPTEKLRDFDNPVKLIVLRNVRQSVICVVLQSSSQVCMVHKIFIA